MNSNWINLRAKYGSNMIAIFFWLIFCVSVRASPSTGCSNCRYFRVHGMQSVDCFNTGLWEIPQCLKTGIEVLDLSYNRIRKIRKNDLERYSNLKYLYLADNMITNINEEALLEKTSLEILDLSYNSFSSIPSAVFQLPSLTRLSISVNQITNIAEEVERSKPILSQLIKLDIGYNTIRELPNFDMMPTLIYYNISGNQEVLVKTSHFSGLCMLETLVMQNFSAVFERPCDCLNLQRWLSERKVTFIENFKCENIDCPYLIPQEDLEIHKKCLDIHWADALRRILLTIVLPGCLFIFFIIFIVILYAYRRKINKRNRRKSVQHTVTRPLYKEPL